MLPNKSHLQIIVRELEKFNPKEDEYRYSYFFNRCRAIFSPVQQTDLNLKLVSFKDDNILDSLTAEKTLKTVYVDKSLFGRKPVLRIYDDEGSFEKVVVNLNKIEKDLNSILVWCRKQIIKLVKDEQIDFEKVNIIDLDEAKK